MVCIRLLTYKPEHMVWTRRVCNLLLARKPQIETT